MSPTRRLAAIAVADVVGYSRLMEADEAGTLATLKQRRVEILDPTVRAHGGRIVKLMGDGVLLEFASAVNAVKAALELQAKFTEANQSLPESRHIILRIGINLGDVIGEGSDIYGDGVNIAARLEALAQPGGLCVSDKVHAELRGKIDADFEDIGEQQLKNIALPVRVYHHSSKALRVAAPALALPDKPSIGILPIQNMSGDPEQEYFADGMVEEIITALSRMKWLFVIARNSSFTYKGRAVDVKQVGRELGVRYVLEGSVRKAANRLRITGQLIDAATGAHLWAERYEGSLEDVFDLQDRVTARVVGAIAPKLEQAEIELSKRKPTTSLNAYDHYLRGVASLNEWTIAGGNEALSHFYRAIELDPNYATAYGRAAGCFTLRKSLESAPMEKKDLAEAERLARLATELGRMDDIALAEAGTVLSYVLGDNRSGMALIERALALNPNYALAWRAASWGKQWDGQIETAIDYCLRAMHLSPQDTSMFQTQSAMAFAHFTAGRHEEALSWAERALSDRPNHPPALQAAAASLALLGRQREAEGAARRYMQEDPAFQLCTLQDTLPYGNPEHLAHWIEALRKAGLPE